MCGDELLALTSLSLNHSRLSLSRPLKPLSLPLPPYHSLMRTDLAIQSSPDTWDVIIPEHPTDLLQWASALAGDALVVCWLRNVCSVLELRSLESGELVRDIPLPGLGSVASFSGKGAVERHAKTLQQARRVVASARSTLCPVLF